MAIDKKTEKAEEAKETTVVEVQSSGKTLATLSREARQARIDAHRKERNAFLYGGGKEAIGEDPEDDKDVIKQSA